jgi:phage terminase large subunit
MPRDLEIPTAEVFTPLLNPARYKGAWGGRGSAKSWFFGDLTIDDCTCNPGLRVVCIREVQKSLDQSVKRLIQDRLEVHGLGERDGFRVLNTHIETPGDGVIIFQGMQNHTADSIKSLEGFDRAWVEEAQSLSQRSLDLLRPTIRKEQSELWFSWNPRSPNDPIDQFLRNANLPPDAVVVKANYRDNPWFPEILRREMEWDRARNVDKYTHVWEGGYETHSEARVFKNWRVEEFETALLAPFLYGGDWGFSVDPSVLVRCYLVGRTLFVDYEAYQIGCEIDSLPQLFDTVPDSRKHAITADSARPETISYLKRHGFPKLKPAIKGKDSVKEGVMFLQNYDIVVHPRCRHTIDELSSYSYKKDPLTDAILPVLADKENHVIDSLRYAVEDIRRGFDYKKAGMTSEATW